MCRAKCQHFLNFATVLLMVSWKGAAQDTSKMTGCPRNEVAITGTPDTFKFNSTNMTQFSYGIAANVVAVLLYGSNFVPIKRVETGDGMFFQWINCAAIWMVSVVGDIMLQSPKFHPFAMLGGVIWATGNITVVPIVKAIGLGLGILLWGSSSLLMGWASSRFGWFGISAQEVSRPILNYCGAGLCLLRGCLLAVVSGLFYGSSFTPVLYIKSHSSCHDSIFHGASVYDLDYVYAQCSGIFAASTAYFAIYCAAMNNRPRVYSRAILPGLLTGLMWALGTYCWFLANDYLSAVITFPIVTAGYGLVAALWGSLAFREIRGLVNGLIFLMASCVVLAGSLLTAVSNL